MKQHILKRKKGVTLVELCVVIALVAIIGSSVVTFSALVKRRTDASSQNGAVLEDLSNVEMTLKQWIMHFDNADYSFALKDDGKAIVAKSAKDGSVVSRISLNEDKTMLVSEDRVTLEVSRLLGMKFEIIESAKTHRSLIRCTVQYHTANSDDVKSAWLMFATHAQGAVLTR